MNNPGVMIKKWLWVAYPLVVVVFMVISAQYLFLDQTKWSSLVEDQQQVQEKEAQTAQLKAKLSALSGVNLDQETENLKYLLQVQPASKTVWNLVSELKAAATSSGVAVLGYKGGTGEVKEASDSAAAAPDESEQMVLTVQLETKNLSQLNEFLTFLDKQLPLVRINKIDLSKNKQTVEIEGAWAPWTPVAGSSQPIPQYGTETSKVKERLAGFESLPEAAPGEASASGSEANPF